MAISELRLTVLRSDALVYDAIGVHKGAVQTTKDGCVEGGRFSGEEFESFKKSLSTSAHKGISERSTK